MPQILNERVCQRMWDKACTAKDMAHAIGMERKTISKMRTDPEYDPKVSTLVRVAEYLDTTPAWLMGWEERIVEVDRIVEVEKPVEVIKEVRRKFFNPKWEEGNHEEGPV